MTLSVGSLFSGCGGIDEACERAGMRVAWQCEIDPQCRRVLAHHWPGVTCYEDVRAINGDNVPRVNVLVGGFPCQDLSVAGRRAGLAGERSGLFYEFMRIADELIPDWILIENVPGLLSSNGGRDMGAIIRELGYMGYGYAWRVLDAQWFGVPQRRRRVFIVGCLRDWSAPAAVLFEPEGLCRDHPPMRQAGETVAGTLGGGPGKRGWSGDTDRMTFLAHALKSPGRGGANYRADGSDNLVAHTLRAEGHDASEDGTGRGTPLVAFDTTQITSAANYSNPRPGDPCHPLAAGAHAPAIAFDWRSARAPAVMDRMAVRRLTPLECSRLQGLPDDWLDIPGLSDSAKYRMLGNSVAVPCVEWITRRMAACEEVPA